MRKIVLDIQQPARRISLSCVNLEAANIIAYKKQSTIDNPDNIWAFLIVRPDSGFCGFCYINDIISGNFDNIKFKSHNEINSITKALNFDKKVIMFDNYNEFLKVSNSYIDNGY